MDRDTAREYLRAAGEEFRGMRVTYEAARDHVREAVIAAVRAEVPQKEITELTGYTRENIRKIARSAGIESAREMSS